MADRARAWLLTESDRREVASWFANRARSVDRCQEPAQEGLHMLAARGLLSRGVPEALGGDGGGLMEMAEVIAAVAGSCLTSAFVLWCHRMFLEYVSSSGNPFLLEEVLPRALRVERFGATGLANAMKHVALLEELRVTAEPRDGGYLLSGKLPWVSNLVGDRFVVAVAARSGSSITIIAVPGDIPGVRPGPRMPLFGLEGTASASLLFDEVQLDAKWAITRDGGAFLAKVRPVFLILQSALAWGLAESALASVYEKLSGPRRILEKEAERLDQALDRLVTELRAIAGVYDAGASWPNRSEHDGTPSEANGRQDLLYRSLKVRKELAELAVESTWLELEAAGGAGYLSESDTARRLREAAFFPVQSPSLVQLRAELARYEEALAPAAGAQGLGVQGFGAHRLGKEGVL